MIGAAQQTLSAAGYGGQRLVLGDVTHLPFPADTFDVVIITGAIGLFRRTFQRQALSELARVARREVRLLEPYKKRPGLYPSRVLGCLTASIRFLMTCLANAGWMPAWNGLL